MTAKEQKAEEAIERATLEANVVAEEVIEAAGAASDDAAVALPPVISPVISPVDPTGLAAKWNAATTEQPYSREDFLADTVELDYGPPEAGRAYLLALTAKSNRAEAANWSSARNSLAAISVAYTQLPKDERWNWEEGEPAAAPSPVSVDTILRDEAAEQREAGRIEEAVLNASVVAHETVRTYRATQGDRTMPDWGRATSAEQEATRARVRLVPHADPVIDGTLPPEEQIFNAVAAIVLDSLNAL